jgi:hypothetical protein
LIFQEKWQMTKFHLAASILNVNKRKLKYLRGKEYIVNGRNVLPSPKECAIALAKLMRDLAPTAGDDSTAQPTKRPRLDKDTAFLSDESESDISDGESSHPDEPLKKELDEIRR